MRTRAWSSILFTFVALASACTPRDRSVDGPPPNAPRRGASTSGAPLADAPRTPLVLAPASPDFDLAGFIADGSHLYFAHRGPRGIERVPVTGGAAQTVLAGTDHPITSFAVDASDVYWTSGRRTGTETSEEMLGRPTARAGHFEGVVAHARKDGAAPKELSAGRFKPDDVRVDGSNVYWVMVRKKESTLVRLPPGTDAPSIVAHGTFAPESLVVSGGHAYWIDPEGGPAVMGVALSGGEPIKIALGAPDNPVHPVRLASDATSLYWTDSGPNAESGAVVRVPIGEGVASVLAEGRASPRGIAVKDGVVFWADKGHASANFHDGAILKTAAAGGAPVTLASGLYAPDRVAVSASHVFWTELDGTVKAMAR